MRFRYVDASHALSKRCMAAEFGEASKACLVYAYTLALTINAFSAFFSRLTLCSMCTVSGK